MSLAALCHAIVFCDFLIEVREGRGGGTTDGAD